MSQAANTISPIRAAISELEGEFTLLEPAALDAAIVGLAAAFGDECGSICYDRDMVNDILAAEGLSPGDADGFFAGVVSADVDDEVPQLITSAQALMAAHKVSTIREAINNIDGEFLLLEPASMDSAIAGLLSERGNTAGVVCYDRDMVIDILMKDGMDRDEAEEFFSFNIEGAYMGEATPVYLTSAKTLLEYADLVN